MALVVLLEFALSVLIVAHVNNHNQSLILYYTARLDA